MLQFKVRRFGPLWRFRVQGDPRWRGLHLGKESARTAGAAAASKASGPKVAATTIPAVATADVRCDPPSP